jgi:2-oxoisovalerate ferredoxin oxidoreductase beta subunit
MLPVFPLNVFRDRKPEVIPSADIPRRTVVELLGLSEEHASTPAAAGRVEATKNLNIKIAGFGGQGVLLLGQIIAEIGMRQGLEVSWLPSYGPEMRSGSAHCHTCLSSERIGSPLISHPDVLVAMNEISLRKFAPQVPAGGLILYNRDALPERFSAQARVVAVPAADLADQLGTAKVANVVMLGALLEEVSLLSPEVTDGVLAATVGIKAGGRFLEINRKALRAGREYMRTARVLA